MSHSAKRMTKGGISPKGYVFYLHCHPLKIVTLIIQLSHKFYDDVICFMVYRRILFMYILSVR